ncbi:MAG: acyl-ACP--UDP-N-acetylglucosamine O-acyltransferase [Pirellulales bacterium]|jgi:UDP-N-acetylglucosamine acyltransferase|nr:acyl-ACP--UDP-N-acetylglucosamine O-acyltransferase [Thermoguttaceae bacterium]MDD4786996.1 acyl-ACP--UDP-N-acetylglucosamine O-acyltransferase [Pirellulales bacterium]MDI9446150.1 acyl-ACP--UDP-N-acetylglucosamine O-acyltransferase [Planctomycetota bacterium]NLZ00255.1 acyl-ACP--UDP-N-acetylglucosamine O-acyltransferase [Pirellulaceae bacterium]
MATYVADHVSIDPRAEIAEDVHIGPFCVVGPDVRIGHGTRLENHVTLMGHVELGEHNRVYPGAVIGGEPQDISFGGAATRVVIGDHNIIRESVTINRGSEKEDGITRIGSNNFLMACCHVAHDCKIGNHVIITNSTLLGGHVHVHDHAILSGGSAVHHFATIGSYAFVGGLSAVRCDVPPYVLVEGHPARPRCINIVALKRNNFALAEIEALSEAFRLLYRAKVGLENAREILNGKGDLNYHVNRLLEFVARQQGGAHGRGRERRRAA